MLTIYKYKLEPGITRLNLSKNAWILTAQMQGDQPTVWALVDTETIGSEIRELLVFGTGHEVPSDSELEYINTFQMGPLVWHVFERIK